jgi:hypothetical protein
MSLMGSEADIGIRQSKVRCSPEIGHCLSGRAKPNGTPIEGYGTLDERVLA